jgi:hypothetical protein
MFPKSVHTINVENEFILIYGTLRSEHMSHFLLFGAAGLGFLAIQEAKSPAKSMLVNVLVDAVTPFLPFCISSTSFLISGSTT